MTHSRDTYARVMLHIHICMCHHDHDPLSNTATHCNTLQHTVTHLCICHHDTLSCTAGKYTHVISMFHVYTATHCNTLQHTATHCNTLQHTAAHCNTPQHTYACVIMTLCLALLANARMSNASFMCTLQHTATHCNTLQHTAKHLCICHHDTLSCTAGKYTHVICMFHSRIIRIYALICMSHVTRQWSNHDAYTRNTHMT